MVPKTGTKNGTKNGNQKWYQKREPKKKNHGTLNFGAFLKKIDASSLLIPRKWSAACLNHISQPVEVSFVCYVTFPPVNNLVISV